MKPNQQKGKKLIKLTKNNKIHKEGFDAGYKKAFKDLENHVDRFVSLQENNAGLNEEDALNLQMGIEGFLLSYKLKGKGKI